MLHKLNNTNRIICPICGQNTRLKYNNDTIILRFPLSCPNCKQETTIDLIDKKVYLSLSATK